MSAVVQATCPGCKNTLRIPANLLSKPIRCKHCQTVMIPRQPTATTDQVTANTPAPTRKKGPPPLATAPAVATPVEQTTARKKRKADAFANFDEENDASATPPTHRRRGGSWVPLILMALLLGTGGTVVAMFWPQFKAILNGESPPSLTAQNEKQGEGTTPQGTKDSTPGPGPTTKDGGTPTVTTNPGPGTQPQPTGAFPRRALIVSVHNYLFANMIHPGFSLKEAHNLTTFTNALNRGLRIPLTQVAHLSDAAGKGMARAPLKEVIQKTTSDFINGSRGQDRVVLFLIGHTTEIEDKLYFVPIDGEMEVVDRLIPMQWFYDQMAGSKARQKILVVDVNRENPTYGHERPASGPMSDKLEAMLKAPPAGVQVWSACSKGGMSYETDDSPMGIFLDSIWAAVLPDKPGTGFQGKIQRPNDLLPLGELNDLVNRKMKEDLGPLGLTQAGFVAGTDNDNGVALDPKEPAPATPALAASPSQQGGAATMAAIKSVLDDIAVPPIKVSKLDNSINYSMLPPLSAGMGDFQAGGEPTKLREKIRDARAVLWAVSGAADIPNDLKTKVADIQKVIKVDLSVLKDGYSIPTNEATFKIRVEADGRQVAVILGELSQAHEDLKELLPMKEMETKRWQANFDFVVAHLEAQIAYLYEYQSMLGQMRKELPAYDPKVHRGWKLASRTDLTGDSTGKKLAKSSTKTLTSLTEDMKGTPWEILAKREKLTALGLEWKPSR